MMTSKKLNEYSSGLPEKHGVGLLLKKGMARLSINKGAAKRQETEFMMVRLGDFLGTFALLLLGHYLVDHLTGAFLSSTITLHTPPCGTRYALLRCSDLADADWGLRSDPMLCPKFRTG